MPRGSCRSPMMERPEHLPLGRLLRNSGLLLSAVRGDATALQQHLTEFIEALPAEIAARLDMMVLQSVDQLTQVLDDLSVAFLAASGGLDEGRTDLWPIIMGELKLQKVRDALTHGNDTGELKSHVELF